MQSTVRRCNNQNSDQGLIKTFQGFWVFSQMKIAKLSCNLLQCLHPWEERKRARIENMKTIENQILIGESFVLPHSKEMLYFVPKRWGFFLFVLFNTNHTLAKKVLFLVFSIVPLHWGWTVLTASYLAKTKKTSHFSGMLIFKQKILHHGRSATCEIVLCSYRNQALRYKTVSRYRRYQVLKLCCQEETERAL